MINDDQLNTLAISLGLVMMALIVIYHAISSSVGKSVKT
ncbi:hypothetical protein HG537_0C00550 [Torulaspora globosa]|uniref:Dolichyl-diphosphooligosaccharide--protein glycosyltransferase subunit 4 n=1 Tax=Torulaspora globosa TaxID=48254 RepID=A0A7H9HNR2_9SACH|nr:hypothetical protein HG537_0C00550 [Torulaspora sp. CBS 2947]